MSKLRLDFAEDEQHVPETATVKEFSKVEHAVAYTEVISQVKDIFEEEKTDDRPKR